MTLLVHLNSVLSCFSKAELDQAKVCAEGSTVWACGLERLSGLWL